MTDTVKSDADVKTAARDWLLRLELEQPSADDQRQCRAWRAADPRHDAAYRRFESIWRDTAMLKDLESLAPLPPDIPTHPRRTWIMAGAALAASIAMVWVTVGFDRLTEWIPRSSGHYATRTGELRTLRLVDGSTLALGARSSLELSLEDYVRRVALTSGEAYFSVAKDPRRPFIVEAGDKQVRVLGTAFEVRRQGMGLRVLVAEGSVEVVQTPSRRSAVQVQQLIEKQLLRAGEEARAQIGGAIQAPQPAPRMGTAAWRQGRRVYVDAPLREVVSDANRYSRRRIEIGDPNVAEMSVSVTYPSDQVSEMLAALERSLPVEIEQRDKDGSILIKGRRNGSSSDAQPL